MNGTRALQRWAIVVLAMLLAVLTGSAAMSSEQTSPSESPSERSAEASSGSPSAAASEDAPDTVEDTPAPSAAATGQPGASPTSAESEAVPDRGTIAGIVLEVFCYGDDLDVPQSQAAQDCAALGEFGLTWEQVLDILDATGDVIDTAFPQILPDALPSGYPTHGAWRASDPVLPDGWRVIECPFLGDADDAVTNGVGQVLEAEALPYVDRRHVVCYQRTGIDGGGEIPVPSRIDTGAGGTAT
jgi:hypothetical protein